MNHSDNLMKPTGETIATIKETVAQSSKAYLREAKTSRDPERSRALEAIAIERAILAELLEDISRSDFRSQTSFRPDSKRSKACSIAQLDKKLYRACSSMYRKCKDKSLRKLFRDMRSNVAGLGAAAWSNGYSNPNLA